MPIEDNRNIKIMRQNRYTSTPPVVKNLLIINILVFAAMELIPGAHNWMIEKLALFYPASPYFMPHQVITHMFMHGGFMHILTNMFALWMFGRVLEWDLGPKRFLIYYFVCGIGAAALHMGVTWLELQPLMAGGAGNYAEIMMRINTPTVGASGAIFGILLAFGMLHPNSTIMLLFPPIPMKAKYFVIIYGVLELFLGVSGTADNIAHFAHVGGMLFGFLLLLYWKKTNKIYY